MQPLSRRLPPAAAAARRGVCGPSAPLAPAARPGSLEGPATPLPGPRRPRSPGLLLLQPLLPLLLPQATARAADNAVIREILDGDQLFVDARRARLNQKASTPELVSTGASRGALAFPGGAVARINRFSKMRLGQRCFLLDSGQVLVSGQTSGCTRSARLSVRGTNDLLEVDERGESQLSVLEGSVEVEPLRDGEPEGAAPTTVNAGQRLRLSAQGVVLTLLALSKGEDRRAAGALSLVAPSAWWRLAMISWRPSAGRGVSA